MEGKLQVNLDSNMLPIEVGLCLQLGLRNGIHEGVLVTYVSIMGSCLRKSM